MRALEPRRSGYAVNPVDGVRSYYEVFGPEDAPRTLLCLPTWSLVHSRCWKMQVPYFARRGFRVVTFDGRGNGRSDRPERGYTAGHFAGDALAVCAEVGAQQTALLALSAGGRPAIQLAAEHPELVSQLVMIAPAIRLDGGGRRGLDEFMNEPPNREGWNKYNAAHWREDFRDFTTWFIGEIFSDPHSTKPIDDFLDWSTGTTAEILIATTLESPTPQALEWCQAIRCPTLLIHGDEDRIIPLANSLRLQAEIPNCELAIFEGSGHAPNARDPVMVNLIIHDFLNQTGARPAKRESVDARA